MLPSWLIVVLYGAINCILVPAAISVDAISEATPVLLIETALMVFVSSIVKGVSEYSVDSDEGSVPSVV